ncbi:MAG TPA: hypothetical protein VLL72_06420 [Kiloniellales bacterium]|nr:hypothetical protein [Kiloniellales bacterium]
MRNAVGVVLLLAAIGLVWYGLTSFDVLPASLRFPVGSEYGGLLGRRI